MSQNQNQKKKFKSHLINNLNPIKNSKQIITQAKKIMQKYAKRLNNFSLKNKK